MFTIVGTQQCPYCLRAKALLDRNNIPYGYLDVTHDYAQKDKLREQGLKTVPQIWHTDTNEHVGGFDDLVVYLERYNGSD